MNREWRKKKDPPLVSSLWGHRSLVFALAKREFSGRYHGTVGGIIWSFIHPLFLLTVYTLAFGIILQIRWAESEKTSDFALMMFAGLIVYNATSELLSRATLLVTSNPNYVKKIVFPLELLPIVTVLMVMTHAVIGMAVWFIGYAVLSGPLHINAIFFPFVFLCLVPVLLGLGWLLSALGVFLKDISQLVNMSIHVLLFLTPIFYSIESVPPILRQLILMNPLTFIVEELRQVVFYGSQPSWSDLLLYLFVSSVLAWSALWFFRRVRPSFADLV